MRQALDDGDLLAAVVGPGDFTKSGHFLLIRDFTDEGFILNDPNSAENSARLWPFDVLLPQIKNIWALSAGKTMKNVEPLKWLQKDSSSVSVVIFYAPVHLTISKHAKIKQKS